MKVKPSTISKTLSTFLTFFLLIQLIAGIFLFVPKPQEAKADGTSWYNSSWLYRRQLTFNNSGQSENLTNFPVSVHLTSSNFDFTKAKNNGEDIRFTDSDGITLLKYEIEKWDKSGQDAYIWVKAPQIDGSSATDNIYIYYGNSSASDGQDANNVWDSNFKMVQHLNQDPSGTAPQMLDSTLNYRDGTSYGSMVTGDQVAGQIGGSLDFDGTNKYIGVGVSNKLFAKSVSNPMITGQFGSVWYNGANDYHAYYSDGTNILHATSSDGVNWTVDTAHNPVLTPTTGVIGTSMVWKESSTWYMLYRSNEWGSGIKIGLATSSDGFSWTKNSSNPVLSPTTATWDAEGLPTNGIDPWGIIKVDSTYYLWYNTVGATPRKAGLATSIDLVHWTKDANNPIFTNNQYCIFPFKYGGYYYMLVPYFSGTEWTLDNWSHQIRIYRDDSPTFYPSEREYLGIAILSGNRGAFDDNYLDTPSILTNDITRTTFPDSNIWMYYTGKQYGGGWKHGLATMSFTDLTSLTPKDETIEDSLRITDAITLETWVKIDATWSYNIYALDKAYSYTLLLRKINGQYYIGMKLATDLSYAYATSSIGQLSIGPWYYIVMKYDSSINTVTYYINGDQSGTDITTGSGKLSTTSDFGFKISDPDNGFNGKIDETRVSNVARSANWIKAQYLSMNGSFVNFNAEQAISATPTMGTPTVLSSSAIRWKFTDNSDDETGFRVYTNADAIATSSATANLTYLDETGLSENTQYIRYVKAYNSYGESASSSAAASKYTLIQAPTGLSFGSVGVNSITVSGSGTLPNLASGSSGVYFDETSGSSGGSDSSWLQANSYQDTGLSENTQYTYRVKAQNGDSTETSYTATSSKYTLADTPTNFDNSATRDSISLTVDSFPNASSGSSGYYFYGTDNPNRNSGWISKNSWADTGLTCGTKYTYGVKYRNGDSVETSAVTLAQNTEPCVSEGGASVDAPRPSDLPNSPELALTDTDQKPTPPTKTTLNPQGDFGILINGGTESTNNRKVKLKLFAGSDTKYMLLSENPKFSGAVQEKYVPDKSWTLSRSDGKKTIYAKFLTLYDVASKVVSDSVILDTTAPPLSITEPLNYSSLTDNTPTVKGTSEPESTIVLELQTQDGAKSYYSTDTDENGNWDYTFLTPLTNQDYILKVTAQDALDNISKPQTLSFKIQTQKVTLKPEIPVLSPPISPPSTEEQPTPPEKPQIENPDEGRITPPPAEPEQGVPEEQEEEIPPSAPEKQASVPPADLLTNAPFFESLYGNISLKHVSPEMPLTLVSGQKLKSFVKPIKPVKAIKVTIIFQKPAERDMSYETKNSVLSSILGIPSAQAQTWRIAEYTLTDENNDGIYEGEITLPQTTGTYLIRITLFYADGTLENLDTETLIDPKGYIYTPTKDNQETRINKATISLYSFNSETSQFELWGSAKYGQENPQTTGKTGEYEFLVPEGKYYLQITAKGYQPYKGEAFQAQEGDVIHQNIELTPEKKLNPKWLILPGIIIMVLVGGVGIGVWKKRRG